MHFFYILQYPHRVKLILATISPTRSRAKSGAAATLGGGFPCPRLALPPLRGPGARLRSRAAGVAGSPGRPYCARPHPARQPGQAAHVGGVRRADWPPARQRHAIAGAGHRPGRRLVQLQPVRAPACCSRLEPSRCPTSSPASCLAEQIYRALTILAGHPYHSGH